MFPVCCGIGLSFLTPCMNTQVRADSYELIQHEIQPDKLKVELVHKKTHRTVWQGTTSYVHAVAWLMHHRALALILDKPLKDNSEGYFRLLLWQIGKKPRLYDYIAPFADLEGIWELRMVAGW